jgi:hypothetical protein
MYVVEIPLGEIATGLHLWRDLVLVEFRKAPQPERSTFLGNCGHIVKITRAQAAADCQLNTFQQSSGASVFLEPVHGDRRSAADGVPAAAPWQTVTCPMTRRLEVRQKSLR